MSAPLENLRNDIEALSLHILQALNHRARLVLDVAQEKQRLGLGLRDPHRESLLLNRIADQNQGPLSETALRRFFQEIFDASVHLMGKSSKSSMLVAKRDVPPKPISIKEHTIGPGASIYLAGPCSIESEEQFHEVALGLSKLGVGFLRGGAFKPRTSPYAFQGLGARGLKILKSVGDALGMATVTEAISPNHVDEVAQHADMLQIGARNMYNYELLRAAGQSGKPVLLKRGLSATLDEWLNAAEYVALSGNEQILLCERGIRTFGADTRNTLDLSIVPLAMSRSHLPIIVDVSHAAGRRDILGPLASAAFASGAHGVMVEVHPDPDMAKSDAQQQITVEDFAALQRFVLKTLQDTLSQLQNPNGSTKTPAVHAARSASPKEWVNPRHASIQGANP